MGLGIAVQEEKRRAGAAGLAVDDDFRGVTDGDVKGAEVIEQHLDGVMNDLKCVQRLGVL